MITVGFIEGRGWCVTRGSEDSKQEYLHRDKVWRPSTQSEGGQYSGNSGYFPYREKAMSAAAEFGDEIRVLKRV